MHGPGPTAVDDVVVDDAPTLELPVVPASAVPDDGTFPAGVVPPGTPPSTVPLPPSRGANWWADLGAAAASGSAKVDAAMAEATLAARRVRSAAVRQAGAAGRASWHGFVALLAAAVTLVCGALAWAFRFLRLRLPTVVVLSVVVLGLRAVPWGQVGGTVHSVVDEVRGWSATTTTTTTTTTPAPATPTTSPPRTSGFTGDDGYLPEDEVGGSDVDAGPPLTAPDPSEPDPYEPDPYEPDRTDDRGGQYVETVRPGQATYRVPTPTTAPAPVPRPAPPTTTRPSPTTSAPD